MKDERQVLFKNVEACVRSALLEEVFTTPKPGLVDLYDTGAHSDMNVMTFVKSADAVAPYIADMFKEGYCWNRELESLFPAVRRIGRMAEQAMFQATSGINTHKGILFTMGILAASAGRCFRQNGEAELLEILTTAEKMTSRILEQELLAMKNKRAVTHGEQLYQSYGEKGIRGEAAKGFPILGNIAYPLMRRCRMEGKDTNLTNLEVLLHIIAGLRDTNVLSRGGIDGLRWIQKKAGEIILAGGAFSVEGYQELCQMNHECIRKNLSPGGAADMLAATLFLCHLEERAWIK